MYRTFAILFIAAILSAVGKNADATSRNFDDSGLTFQKVDPFVKVLPEAAAFRKAPDYEDAARGAHVEFQFVLRSSLSLNDLTISCSSLNDLSGNEITDVRIGMVGLVTVGELAGEPAHDVLHSISGLFPDPILESDRYSIPANQAACVWITVGVGKDAPAGLYSGKVKIGGKAGRKRFSRVGEISVRVRPVTLRKPRFQSTNWCFDSDRCLSLYNGGKPVERYSDLYWQYMKDMAALLHEAYQTITRVDIFGLIGMNHDRDGKWQFDFSRFDEQVRFYESMGVLDRLHGAEFGGRKEPVWTSEAALSVPVIKDGKPSREMRTLDEPGVKEFYSEFVPAFVGHLKEIGMYDRYVQQVCDEPIDENSESYSEIVKFLKSLAPGLKVMEACQTTKAVGAIDVWVPQLNFWNDNYRFFEDRKSAGEELWYYTCCFPRGEYPNRFIEQPLLKGRMLYWMGFKYGAAGHLHWGFNYWNDNPFEETTNPGAGSILPGGDSWIVYPGYRKFLRSIRYEQMRDGIEDIALLEMLSEKDSAMARGICDDLITSWWVYCTSPARYRAAKSRLLDSLE